MKFPKVMKKKTNNNLNQIRNNVYKSIKEDNADNNKSFESSERIDSNKKKKSDDKDKEKESEKGCNKKCFYCCLPCLSCLSCCSCDCDCVCNSDCKLKYFCCCCCHCCDCNFSLEDCCDALINICCGVCMHILGLD